MKRNYSLAFCLPILLLLVVRCSVVKRCSETGHGGKRPFRTVLFTPGDYGSANYRIPAIITADDGALVAIADKRKFNEGDLPEDIDIVCRRSTDNGRTWSEPCAIAEGKGKDCGFGDCAVVKTNNKNELLAVFVGGVGLWKSTPNKPMRSYVTRSRDNGVTWEQHEDITDFIFGASCPDASRRLWHASFFASGNGLLTSTGRIIFVAAVRETQDNTLNNYAVYSDDNGLTWQVSTKACTGGDEAKVTELPDGRILMSIRTQGNRLYNISDDGGETWKSAVSQWNGLTAPACNGDMMSYPSSEFDANNNILMHSLPVGNDRSHVSVCVSYDNGLTWPVQKCVVHGFSAYSSLCVLQDGSIGLLVEEKKRENDGYSIVFYRFPLSWLLESGR